MELSEFRHSKNVCGISWIFTEKIFSIRSTNDRLFVSVSPRLQCTRWASCRWQRWSQWCQTQSTRACSSFWGEREGKQRADMFVSNTLKHIPTPNRPCTRARCHWPKAPFVLRAVDTYWSCPVPWVMSHFETNSLGQLWAMWPQRSKLHWCSLKPLKSRRLALAESMLRCCTTEN